MTEKYAKKSMKEKRRYLRHNLTKAEAILWKYLKQKQIKGQRFLRQFSIGKYIVDFYCPNINLAIEVDGDTHFSDQDKTYDKQRQQIIEKLGITFLRYSNLEIYEGLEEVLKKIETQVKQLLNPPTPLS